MKVHPMWEHYPTLQQDLTDVLDIIEKSIKIRDKNIEGTIKTMIYAGGKLLRPAFVILCSQIGPDHDRQQALHIAAALEVLHMATLVHDDIIDDADTRRGKQTLQSKFGKDHALYAGDYLFCICFKLLAIHSNNLGNIEFNTRAMEKILLGELDQMAMRYNTDMTLKQYLKQISGKTAQLFALSCYLGAELSEASFKQKHAARKIGHYIGMAFQILDDILDYTQGSENLGKPVLNDIKQGVYSLPLIYALNQNREAFKPYLAKKEQLSDEDLDTVLALIQTYHGVEKAQELASKYTSKALNLINSLPEGEYKKDMLNITTSLLKRTL